MQDVPMRDLQAREVWWAFVVAGVRDKVGATLLALGLGLSAWLFATRMTPEHVEGVVVLCLPILSRPMRRPKP